MKKIPMWASLRKVVPKRKQKLSSILSYKISTCLKKALKIQITTILKLYQEQVLKQVLKLAPKLAEKLALELKEVREKLQLLSSWFTIYKGKWMAVKNLIMALIYEVKNKSREILLAAQLENLSKTVTN